MLGFDVEAVGLREALARPLEGSAGEVFARGAGARRVAAPERDTAAAEVPRASQDDIRWAGVKQRAARWFARLEAEEHRALSAARTAPTAQPPARTAPATVAVAVAAARPAAHK